MIIVITVFLFGPTTIVEISCVSIKAVCGGSFDEVENMVLNTNMKFLGATISNICGINHFRCSHIRFSIKEGIREDQDYARSITWGRKHGCYSVDTKIKAVSGIVLELSVMAYLTFR